MRNSKVFCEGSAQGLFLSAIGTATNECLQDEDFLEFFVCSKDAIDEENV